MSSAWRATSGTEGIARARPGHVDSLALLDLLPAGPFDLLSQIPSFWRSPTSGHGFSIPPGLVRPVLQRCHQGGLRAVHHEAKNRSKDRPAGKQELRIRRCTSTWTDPTQALTSPPALPKLGHPRPHSSEKRCDLWTKADLLQASHSSRLCSRKIWGKQCRTNRFRGVHPRVRAEVSPDSQAQGSGPAEGADARDPGLPPVSVAAPRKRSSPILTMHLRLRVARRILLPLLFDSSCPLQRMTDGWRE